MIISIETAVRRAASSGAPSARAAAMQMLGEGRGPLGVDTRLQDRTNIGAVREMAGNRRASTGWRHRTRAARKVQGFRPSQP